ncbi:MAG TPA: TonB C-terminal domain-containing protein [Desulfuromonadales bacterium]|nr:TonB C-terminal domain-containing protein [Desulfuromonadales bacterium]
MSSHSVARGTGLSVSFIASAIIHLAVFLLVAWYGKLFPMDSPVQETYYVDVVNLPVASPQEGTALQSGSQTEQAAVLPPPPPAPSPMPLPLPLPKAAIPAKKPASKTSTDSVGNDSTLAERMAQLQRNQEARQEEAVLDRLRAKVKSAGIGRVGMPNAHGSQAGSDYTAYLQSRLKDAFRETISFSSKNPEMIVRLFIDSDGKLMRRVTERSSGDKAFELSVQRAIDIASEKFPAPPDKRTFESIFVFKPQGISQTRSK